MPKRAVGNADDPLRDASPLRGILQARTMALQVRGWPGFSPGNSQSLVASIASSNGAVPIV